MEKMIYKTHETWGDETYFFTAEKYGEYVAGMESCREGDIEKPVIFLFNDETGFYEGPYFKNYGRDIVKILDWSDQSDLKYEYISD
jgi:hypothetical protein